MRDANPFNLLLSPLKGTNLIEASAGTGKTYTITCLYLRLVLEEHLSPDMILAVTFTEAATLELKDRIRKRLNEAIGAVKEGGSDDRFLTGLVERIDNSEEALARLKGALRDFDEAAVSTIHGFCRRVLYENAFESGSLFDTELIPDEQEVIREIVEDFWRRNFYEASPLFVSYTLDKGLSPTSLMSLAAENRGRPYMKIIPETAGVNPDKQERVFQGSFESLSRSWARAKDEVQGLLIGGGLSKVSYGSDKIPAWLSAMDRFAASNGNNMGLFPGFEKFTSGSIDKALKKGMAPMTHPFFDLCEKLKNARDDLAALYEANLLGIKSALFPYVRREMRQRKAERNIQSFDDLLVKVQRALNQRGGEELALSIRDRYRAVLIDEFQDTDPVQYSLFRRVFGNRNTPFFLIGDPKQAIYGFRGADVFTYMEAAREIGSRYTLLENWRSGQGLVTAVNTVFTSSQTPFIYDEINFYPGTAVEETKSEPLLIENMPSPAFQMWLLDTEKEVGSDKPFNKGEAKRRIKEAVAAEISRLIALGRKGEARLGKRQLREGDIAVLVRTNMEGRDMQRALSAYHIPSVLYSTGSLFDSDEAVEMARVLTGISEPNNETLVRAALSTDIMGLKGETIERLMKDDPAWEEWMVRIRAYHHLWNGRGFIRMFRGLMDTENVLPRLMSFPDGERRNTNILHLQEVLHRAETEQRLGMAALLKWLSEKMVSTDEKTEEYQLRLETDENAVQIATIHKSKGLEYPVVFCPFAWEGSKIKKNAGAFTFHDPSEGMRLILDLGSEKINENRKLAQREELSENLRLLYVALTRAKSRCYMVWGRIRGSETSAQAHLFHGKRVYSEGEDIPSARGFNEMDDQDVRQDLKELTKRAGGEIMLSTLPEEEGVAASYSLDGRKEGLSYRKISVGIDDYWRVSSFSSLTSGTFEVSEQADRDALMPEKSDRGEEEGEVEERADLSSILSFPKGAHAGTFFHDLLEHLDFSGIEGPGLEELAADRLRAYGFEEAWLDPVCRALEGLLNTPLSPGDGELLLSKIGRDSRLNELEFYFPLKRTTPSVLERVFEKNSSRVVPPDIPGTFENLSFKPAEGFMRGFIDMVFQWKNRFYIVDWKSNFLGMDPRDYGQDSLWTAMKSHWYVLQYHIYALALDQYLRMRVPDYRYEDYFGGVFYVFLRGVDPAMGPDYGIFRDLPSPDVIETLRASLLEVSGKA